MRVRLLLAAAALAACGEAATPRSWDGPIPDAAARAPDAAPVDARLFADATPLPDGAALGACGAEAAGPAAPLALADRATTTSTLTLPAAGTDSVATVAVTVDVTHPYPRDLRLELVSPAGTVVLLTEHHGTADGYRNTVFRDDAPVAIADGVGGLVGPHRPEEPLARLAGEEVAGSWTLRLVDEAAGDVGRLERWALRVDACHARICATRTVAVDLVGSGTPTGPGSLESLLTPFLIIADPALTVAAVRVGLSLTSAYDEDLGLRLWSPGATVVRLATGLGGRGSDYVDTVFDDRATAPVAGAFAPFSGTFRPEEPLATFAREPAAGPWLLEVGAPVGPLPAGSLVTLGDRRLEVDLCELECAPGSQAVRVAADGAGAQVSWTVAQVGLIAGAALEVSAESPAPAPLRLVLTPPVGAPLALSTTAAAGSLTGVLLSDAAARGFAEATPPYAGLVRPTTPLAGLAGRAAAGAWKLDVTTAPGGAAAASGVALLLCVSP